MNNPNPFVPQGSLLEQQSKRRSHLKLAVFCALAVGIASLSAMLIQGCKREEDQTQADNNNPPPVDTNTVAATTPDTNPPPIEASNPPVTPPPVQPPQPAVAPAPAPPTETEYVVVKGDTYSKIAKSYGIGWKALEDANPNIPATKLKVGMKLTIPAGASTTGAIAAAETANGMAASGADETYVVRTGDTLSRIARHYNVSVKEIQAENNLSTTRINVGQKLKIPAKTEAAPENAPPAAMTSPASASPPVSTTPGAAPANPPAAPANPPPAQTNPQ
jgi:LysM repeat protein